MRKLLRWLRRPDTLLVLWVAIGLGAFLQADRELRLPDEPREAGIACETLDAGSWIVPTLGRETFLEKPPLTADAMAVAISLCGATPLAVRLFVTLCGIAAALGTCAAMQLWLGRRTGAIAGLILATTVCVATATHRAVTDPPVLAASAFAIWALASGHRSETADRGAPRLRRWRLAVGMGAGLMFLGKGLLGPAQLAVAVTAYVALRVVQRARDPRPPLRAHWMALAAAVTAAPFALGLWYADSARGMDGAFLKEFWFDNHFMRVVDPSQAHQNLGHQEPAYYYAAAAVGAMSPWILLLPALLRSGPWVPRGVRRWLWAGCLFPILAMSVPASKREVYLLPLAPWFAGAAAIALSSLAGANTWRGFRRAAVLTALVAVGLMVTGAVTEALDGERAGFDGLFGEAGACGVEPALLAAYMPEENLRGYRHYRHREPFYRDIRSVSALRFMVYTDRVTSGWLLITRDWEIRHDGVRAEWQGLVDRRRVAPFDRVFTLAAEVWAGRDVYRLYRWDRVTPGN